MHQGRCRAERLTAIIHVRQRLIRHLDEVDRALRRAQIVRGHNSDDFTIEANFVDGDEGLIFGQFEMLVSRQRPQRVEISQMISVQHANNAGESFRFAGVYGDNFCVGVGTREHGTV